MFAAHENRLSFYDDNTILCVVTLLHLNELSVPYISGILLVLTFTETQLYLLKLSFFSQYLFSTSIFDWLLNDIAWNEPIKVEQPINFLSHFLRQLGPML